MRTVGQILQKRRLEKGISLEEVSRQTKIRQDILSSLEDDDYQRLSSIASIKGFLRSYAEFLDLSAENILAIFRRDFKKKEKKKIVPQGLVRPIDKLNFGWGPKKTLIFTVSFFAFLLVFWLTYQYFNLIRPPVLKIYSPSENMQTQQKILSVSGKTEPDSLVTVNGKAVFLDQEGRFEDKVELFPGENKIIIEAISKLEKKTRVERSVFYQVEE